MSIRFNCLTCRMVLKVAEMIVEERKVRCTGCGMVLLLNPDSSSPTGVAVSLPEQELGSKRKTDKALAFRRNLVFAGLGIAVVAVAFGLVWTFMPPADRAAIEGTILLDDKPLEKGRIIFLEQSKGISVEAEIVKGHYTLSRYSGPRIGSNKVMIHGDMPTGKMIDNPKGRPGEQIELMAEAVAPRYNATSSKFFEVKAGANEADFQVHSK